MDKNKSIVCRNKEISEKKIKKKSKKRRRVII
jgi:hypothetical protein